MRLLTRLRSFLFASETTTRLGVYGPPNAGKTTLTNRMADDWGATDVGSASDVPHETQTVQTAEAVTIEHGDAAVTIDIVDTPGVTTEVDYTDFLEFGFDESAARTRARGATTGISEAMKALTDDLDGVLYVVDSTRDPTSQSNHLLVDIAAARDLPLVILANKIDRSTAATDRVTAAFPDHDVIPVSGRTGTNVETVYETLAARFG